MKTLFILNDPPYGTERCYNALRLAHTLLTKEAEVMLGESLRAMSGRLTKRSTVTTRR